MKRKNRKQKELRAKNRKDKKRERIDVLYRNRERERRNIGNIGKQRRGNVKDKNK